MKLKWLFLGTVFAATTAMAEVPKLVVVISIDQFRADYVKRFATHYLPAMSGTKLGGFNYFVDRGTTYADAEYQHIPTSTGPGHAVIMSGSVPALDGIVANTWYDRVLKKPMYCVDDAGAKTIGGNSSPMSPKNLMVTTVGDELKMATHGQSKCVSISFKDRAAILMAGHAADEVVWFEPNTGNWVTSDFYGKEVPKWAQDLNAKQIPQSQMGEVWKPMLPETDYANTGLIPGSKRGATALFEHKLDGKGKNLLRNWATSPYGQKYVFETVKTAVIADKLGSHESTDLLTVNLATNDYIGHAYGPNSPEVMDISVATDRFLSDLLNTLDHQVPGGMKNVLFCITADHGVVPIPEEAHDLYRLPSARMEETAVPEAVNKALSAAYGEGTYVSAFEEPHLYLNADLLASKHIDLTAASELAAKTACKVDGVYAAYGKSSVLLNQIPPTPWSKMIANACHPTRSGDVFVLFNPGQYLGEGTGTGHSAAWAYDRHVPLMFGGWSVKARRVGRPVTVCDLAPTLSEVLGIEMPSGCVGHPLPEVIER